MTDGEFDDALALANGGPIELPGHDQGRRRDQGRDYEQGRDQGQGRDHGHAPPSGDSRIPAPGESRIAAPDDGHGTASDTYAPVFEDSYAWIFGDDRRPTREAGRGRKTAGSREPDRDREPSAETSTGPSAGPSTEAGEQSGQKPAPEPNATPDTKPADPKPGAKPTAKPSPKTGGTGLDDDARLGPYTPWDTAPAPPPESHEPSPTPNARTSSPTPTRRTHHGRPAPTAWRTARAIAARAPEGPLAPAVCPLGSAALGRTLAEPLTALTDLPSFDTSAMDGWAVAGPGPWHLPARPGPGEPEQDAGIGILAGHERSEALADGDAVPIATGARIPPGATAVLRSEHGEVRERLDGGAQLYAPAPAPPGQDIRPRGQECRRGEQLLPAGALVTPAVLGLAAAAGYDELTAYARPRVEVFVLGDELLRSGLPADGLIRDALGPMLGPWLRALGAEAGPTRHLADDADTLYEAIADSTADLVITTGGTAAGPVDHVHPTLRRLGAEILVDGVAVRPGHPMLLACLPRTDETHSDAPPSRTASQLFVGLPGNPLAAVSGLLTLAEPVLRTLAARRRAASCRVPVTATVSGHPHDTRLIPVAYRDDADGEGDSVAVVPLRFSGPAMLRGIAAADALAVVPPGGAARGEYVELLDLPWSADWSAGWSVDWSTGWSADRSADWSAGWTAEAPDTRSNVSPPRPPAPPPASGPPSPPGPHPTGGGAA
ncbi:molybdopterin-binding protein [Streptomyces sp. NPDC017056]|uniref:molybdopterin molybdotransferase MoeA n=1 Tax=Streptomyces sp. NPDC017056 TaxID=3364973 RepID=UPI00379A9B2A